MSLCFFSISLYTFPHLSLSSHTCSHPNQGERSSITGEAGLKDWTKGRARTNIQIYPNTAGKLERQASSRPHRVFLSCPVFGIPRAAESADLVLAMSGDYYAKKHAAHALVPAIARKVMDLGSNVERAMSFK
jgi:3-hydroxyisobutyrate dehydrogenase-like beta-hydroxyacid dehydrogenase